MPGQPEAGAGLGVRFHTKIRAGVGWHGGGDSSSAAAAAVYLSSCCAPAESDPWGRASRSPKKWSPSPPPMVCTSGVTSLP